MSFTPFLLPGTSRPIGLVDVVRKLYRRRVLEQVHLVRTLDAYGLSVVVVRELRRLGVETVQLEETRKDGSVWEYDTRLDTWERRGLRKTLRDRDGEQFFLPLRVLPQGRRLRERPAPKNKGARPPPPQVVRCHACETLLDRARAWTCPRCGNPVHKESCREEAGTCCLRCA